MAKKKQRGEYLKKVPIKFACPNKKCGNRDPSHFLIKESGIVNNMGVEARRDGKIEASYCETDYEQAKYELFCTKCSHSIALKLDNMVL